MKSCAHRTQALCFKCGLKHTECVYVCACLRCAHLELLQLPDVRVTMQLQIPHLVLVFLVLMEPLVFLPLVFLRSKLEQAGKNTAVTASRNQTERFIESPIIAEKLCFERLLLRYSYWAVESSQKINNLIAKPHPIFTIYLLVRIIFFKSTSTGPIWTKLSSNIILRTMWSLWNGKKVLAIHHRSKVWGHPDNFVFSMKTHTFIYQMSCKMNIKCSQDIDKVRNNDFYLKY